MHVLSPARDTLSRGCRYGAVPVVRRTGGLADTVHDVDGADEAVANGFSFDGADESSEDSALDRALHYYRDRPEWWAKVRPWWG